MRRRHWHHFESRVEANVAKILALLNSVQVRATFFVLGWVAERHPDLIKSLADHGHEIASHGYAHELVYGQTPALFREDIKKAKTILEDILGSPILGYRAPSFTITRETHWALQILVEEGYRYDSSVFPVYHDVYGMPGADPWCHSINTSAGILWEIPPTMVKLAGFPLPIAGGGYLRLFPYAVLRALLRRAETQGHPLVVYLHPWELDPNQPRMMGPLLSRVRHYLNLHKTEERLANLLRDFNFAPIRDVVEPVKCEYAKRARFPIVGAGPLSKAS
jgi:polysaccharide deacetylase family protein (PEP-CTERM system associated)